MNIYDKLAIILLILFLVDVAKDALIPMPYSKHRRRRGGKLKKMIDKPINYDELDEGVVPMVKYFNEIGLKTKMSCSGHPGTEMKMFWIEFDRSVTEKDILEFQENHCMQYFGFTSNGFFCKRFYLDKSTNKLVKFESYRYVAYSVDDAMEDLTRWKLDDDMYM